MGSAQPTPCLIWARDLSLNWSNAMKDGKDKFPKNMGLSFWPESWPDELGHTYLEYSPAHDLF